MRVRHVMVVEDDTDLRLNIAELLRSEGYDVQEAGHGQEALQLLRRLPPEARPCCIILDLMMPVMPGEVFVRELAAKHPQDLGRIPIIVTTAKGSADEGIDVPPRTAALLRKPFEIDDLLGVIAQHCNT